MVHFPILPKTAPGPYLRPYCSLSKAVRIWKLAGVIVYCPKYFQKVFHDVYIRHFPPRLSQNSQKAQVIECSKNVKNPIFEIIL